MIHIARVQPTTPEAKASIKSYHQTWNGKAWLAELSLRLSQQPLPDVHTPSTPDAIQVCLNLLEDDSGGVSPLTVELAKEIVALNQPRVDAPAQADIQARMQNSLDPVLKLLDWDNAEPEAQAMLKSALLKYLESHECADDKNFVDFRNSLGPN